MGKSHLAFDQITSHKEITELSVVLYVDSFFYGLWAADGSLAKASYHPYVSLPNVLWLLQYNHSLSHIKILSTLKPYVHLPSEEYEPEHFDLYFSGLYPMDRLQDHKKLVDDFRHYDITTLHYLEQELISQLGETDFQLLHISTAMSNYSHENGKGMICYMVNNIMHVSLRNEQGHLLYNQFRCRYDIDGLYYLMLIFDKFGLDPESEIVNLAGRFNQSSELIEMLSGYVRNLNILDLRSIGARQDLPSSYYDLQICNLCV